MSLQQQLLQKRHVPYTSFNPGQPWFDTSGQLIRAHSGGLLYDPNSNTTYWYGSNFYPEGDAMLNRIINVYSAVGDGLYNWRHEGVAFTMPLLPKCNSAPRTCYADRCKVLLHPNNPEEHRYIMWCKSKPFVSVSTSASAVGPFTLLDVWAPEGHEVGDCSVWADPSAPGVAYFVLSVHPSTYNISKGEARQLKSCRLTDDWLNVTACTNITAEWPRPNKYDGKLEAPSPFLFPAQRVVDDSNLYGILASHCTYWFPNDAVLLTTTDMDAGESGWTRHGNPTHNDTSFSTQVTQVFKIAPGKYIFIADRFEPYIQHNQTGRYVWLPLTITQDNAVTVKWRNQWKL